MKGSLILVRHGESLWNARNVWTGLTDIELSDKGKLEAQQTAGVFTGTPPSLAFTSNLTRAQQTLKIILETIHSTDIPVHKNAALNERDYGEYTGKNKAEVKALLGEEGFLALRRGWDVPVPHGESLKQVYSRVVPYFVEQIEPHVKSGETVLVVAHGNSLRALIKYIEHISDEDIANVELKTGEPVIYHPNEQGSIGRVSI
jgi:2,3-bisphosphoglycerate-dependent phosphoglycerate mutase